MTQAFAAEHADPLPPAPSGESLYEDMLRLSHRAGAVE